MNQKEKNNRLDDLTKKYQSYNVVSEIEKNLSSLSVKKIDINNIDIYPLCDLSLYDLSLYNKLEESILDEGILTPIILFNDNNKKYLINGIKRYLVAKKNNISQIPCVEISIQQEKINEYVLLKIIKNDDNVLIKTNCFKLLITKYNFTQEQIASISSLSLSNIKNILRLDNLPKYIKKDITNNKISYGKARTLLNLDEENQKNLYKEISNHKYSVRDIEILKKDISGKKSRVKIIKNNKVIKIVFLSDEEAENSLEKVKKLFSTK